uniref:AN1-type domain-containing protein n=1 Tax=Arion vulgaris TaxID=1028688 RepID=A0A0B7AZ97_9EUPU
MEFPRLGQHCNEDSCKQLDFLPMKCDACSKIFCRDHIVYATHYCSESYRKNNQVPVCPLCSLPCPIKKGELPDTVVGKHIESDCLSDPAIKRRKVYVHRCSKKGCKKREIVPVACATCRLNFCFHHRHTQDHNCKGFQNSGKSVSNAGVAAILRAQQVSKKSSSSQSTLVTQSTDHNQPEASKIHSDDAKAAVEVNLSSLQGSLSEEDALAMALQMSMNTSAGQDLDHSERMTDQEREDSLLALTLAISEQEASLSRQRPQQSVKA